MEKWPQKPEKYVVFFQVGAKKPEPIAYEKYEPTDLGDDVGSNNSGWYNLKGVLTHKGRSIDSGHYIGWTKNGDKWVKFDDDKVTFRGLTVDFEVHFK